MADMQPIRKYLTESIQALHDYVLLACKNEDMELLAIIEDRINALKKECRELRNQ